MGGPAPADRTTRARAPHVVLERRGSSLSTLDLFGQGFVVLAGAEGEAWCEAAREAGRRHGVAVHAHRVGGGELRDPGGRFGELYGVDVGGDGAALVRPDGVVGWRARVAAEDAAAAVSDALARLVCRVA